MKLTISRTILNAQLTRLRPFAEGKSSIPVLGNFRLEARADRLHLAATDLDSNLQSSCDAQISQPGGICLPARKLADIVKSLPDGDVSIEVKATAATIQSGRTKFRLTGVSIEDFPNIVSPAAGDPVEIPAQLWAEFVARVGQVTTAEESRYTLNGAKVEIGGGKIRMVGTDGHRLALVEATLATDAVAEFLIPRKALLESPKLLEGLDAFSLSLTENHLHLQIGPNLRLTTRLLSGSFPDYTKILPGGNRHEAISAAAELSAAVRRVGLMADERSRAIKMGFGKGAITIQAQSSEHGEGADAVSAEYTGEAFEIGFNTGYVLDAIGDSTQVSILIKDDKTAVEFRPVGEERFVSRSIIMPMRL